ncbi:MAG TPA: acetate--CoA ligase family protein [Beijerinckiaceae bacterium]|nr:acetate--CoA ligase family protein [Beijerinckiaceae bacterium]
MNRSLRGPEGVRALLSPNNVVIAGASDRAGSWSKRVLRSLERMGFPGQIYPLNPRNPTVWDGRTCYPDFASLPEPPDHVVVLVPGRAAIDTIRDAGRAGARSATIFSSGFGEGGDPEGLALGAELQAAIAESGLAVSGPNCLGNLAARHKLMTLTDDRIQQLSRGPVAIFGQSGGIVTAIYRSLLNRGIQPGYAVTVGNEAGLNSADYIRYFAEDVDIKVIACFVEAIKDPAAFREACAAARDAGKPVVLVKIGGSDASRAAALAHTGSLAGSLACFDAVAETIGAIRVDTIDEMVEVVELLTHGHRPTGARVGSITFSGGLKGLLLEAAERNGVEFPALAPRTLDRLREVLGIGTSLGNPLDAGFTALSSREAYFTCIEIMQEDPGLDLLLVQEELPTAEGMNAKAGNLVTVDEMVGRPGAKPVGVVSMASYMYTDFTREFRGRFPRLPVLHEVDKALKAVRAVGRWSVTRARTDEPGAIAAVSPGKAQLRSILDKATATGDGRRVLGEGSSKALIASYGIGAPREIFAQSADEAARAAQDIGYPVVLKLVSPDVQHKTEVGGVVTDLGDAQAVLAAFDRIRANLEAADPAAVFDGVLVAEQAQKGIELVLGVQRDPEVGPVVMFGTGGVHLELQKDVAFGAVPLSEARARRMIDATVAGRLLRGYRGAPPSDVDAVVAALLGLSRLAADLGERLESVDLNPVVAVPGKAGVLSLDALVVLREPRDATSSRNAA